MSHRGAASRLDAPQITAAVIIEVVDADLRVCAPPVSDSDNAPSCTTVLASAPLSAFKFESLDGGSLRIFDSAVSIAISNISLDQVKAWVADFQIRNTAARMNAAALESAMARFDAGLIEFLDKSTAAAARRGDAADATDADAAAEARLRESFPHLPTLSSLRWRGLISNCFLTDVDPEDTDDADILMNYQLELKGSREVGASTATAPGGISAAGADERNIEYIVRVSTADMAWTCYRRFHHFSAMHEAIKMHIEKLKLNAVFPPKKWLGSHLDPIAVKEREEGLALYMQVVSSELALRCHDAVRATFEINNICRAAFCGDVRRVAVLIKFGHNPSQLDSHGRAPIHLATMMRCDDALEYLLAKCAAPPTTPNAAGAGAGTPTRASFASSSFTGDSRAEQAALTSPSGVGISSPSSVSSPGGGRGETRARMIHVDLTDRSGRSALHYAALLGHATAIKLLLNAGANPGFPDQHGMLPLHTAAAEGFLPCVAAILERSDSTEAAPLFTSADPLAKDANGWDARKHAMHNGHSNIAEFLDSHLSSRRAAAALASISSSVLASNAAASIAVTSI